MLLDNVKRTGQLRLYATRLTTDFMGQIAVEISATWLNDRPNPVLVLVVRDASRAETLRRLEEEQAAFEETARKSLEQQAELEQNEVGDFDVFVGAYQASILAISN